MHDLLYRQNTTYIINITNHDIGNTTNNTNKRNCTLKVRVPESRDKADLTKYRKAGREVGGEEGMVPGYVHEDIFKTIVPEDVYEDIFKTIIQEDVHKDIFKTIVP